MAAEIKHLIVLMMENRSFDHMLGYLQSPTYQIDGLDGTETNLNSLGQGVSVNDRAKYSGYLGADPQHNLPDVMQQMFGTPTPAPGQQPAMSGFVLNFEEYAGSPDAAGVIMNCFAPAQLPILTNLATKYACCDRWFCSVPGPTLANRLYVHAGTTRGRLDTLSPEYVAGFRTIYETLFSLNPPVSSTIFYEDWSSALSFEALLFNNQASFFEEYSGFGELCRQNKLPSYCFIEPRYNPEVSVNNTSLPPTDQHPDHDVAAGEGFILEVYDDLRSNDDVWTSSILVIIYDEHGGFYDHVIPPGKYSNPTVPIACSPDGIDCTAPKFDFTQLGPRVPAVIVSPYITPGTICHDKIFDHTSVIATAMKLFAGNQWPSDKLGKRAQVANTFDTLLDLDAAPRMEYPDFDQPPVAAPQALVRVPLSALQHEAVQHAASLERQLPQEDQTGTDPSRIHDEVAAGKYLKQVAGKLLMRGKEAQSRASE